MRGSNAWLALWAASGAVQAAGFGGSVWTAWQTTEGVWRAFWAAFAVAWAFAMVHHLAWGLETQLRVPLEFVQGFMKLGAMLAQLAAMALAKTLMSGPTPAPAPNPHP